ncbi:VOC family protein [Thalassotalea psychrophila]|uniref:VOC family protein n=1 Tax=Thalassotalea psychrophila TaxID=3065647 RepID=A0ABY9TRD6_9GAMM|nr:VOC family protein [Colwelliaceae bacterium SQ149]
MSIEIESVGQIAIAVTKIEEAREFYKNTLGLPLLFDAGPELSFFDCGGTRLMLTTEQGNAKDHKTSVIYYKVNNIEETTKHLLAKGVAFEREPQLVAKMPEHELWIGFLRDPDENLVGLMAELPLCE